MFYFSLGKSFMLILYKKPNQGTIVINKLKKKKNALNFFFLYTGF